HLRSSNRVRPEVQSSERNTIFFNKYGLHSEGSGDVMLMFNVVITLPDELTTPETGLAALLHVNKKGNTGLGTGLSDSWLDTTDAYFSKRRDEALEKTKKTSSLSTDVGRIRAIANWRKVKRNIKKLAK